MRRTECLLLSAVIGTVLLACQMCAWRCAQFDVNEEDAETAPGEQPPPTSDIPQQPQPSFPESYA